MGTSSTARGNAAADAIVSGTTHVSLHTGDPGATGANEATGNGYARQSITMGAASGKTTSNTNAPTWTASGGNLGGGALTYYGLWDSVSGGNFLWGDTISGGGDTVSDGSTYTLPIGNLDVVMP